MNYLDINTTNEIYNSFFNEKVNVIDEHLTLMKLKEELNYLIVLFCKKYECTEVFTEKDIESYNKIFVKHRATSSYNHVRCIMYEIEEILKRIKAVFSNQEVMLKNYLRNVLVHSSMSGHTSDIAVLKTRIYLLIGKFEVDKFDGNLRNYLICLENGLSNTFDLTFLSEMKEILNSINDMISEHISEIEKIILKNEFNFLN